MVAEEIPVAVDDGNFITDATDPVDIGECRCPGRPHERDEAMVYRDLPWDVLVEVGMLSGIAAYRRLVLGGLASWNLVDAAGEPVPITDATVHRLRPDRLNPIAAAINAAFLRAKKPLPNVSGAPSRPSRRESASPNPTIRPRARHTRSS